MAVGSPNSAPPLTFRTRLAYGFGAVAFGVKDNGFSYFLLLYYNQILGLPAAWVGAVLMVSLLVDAVADPLIGYASDRLRSPWGRRHPLMYLAAAPVALAYGLLWRPPEGLPQTTLLIYLLVVATFVRLAISLYEVPSTALVVELAPEYDQRTTLFAHRTFFAWCGGLGAGFLAYAVFLLPDADHPIGQFNPAGYSGMGMGAAALMAAAILISAVGTHGRIRWLRPPSPRSTHQRWEAVQEIAATLRNRSLLVVLGAGVCNALAIGVGAALSVYMLSYFWGLSTPEISLMALAMFVGALTAIVLLPRFAPRVSKRLATMCAIAGYGISALAPAALHLVGAFPDKAAAAYLPALGLANVLSTASMVCSITLLGSMLSDVVEENEVETGQRSEGVIFSANLFVQKCVSGLGVFCAGMILTAVQFPEGASPGQVPIAVLDKLGLSFVATQSLLFVMAIMLLRRYRITREAHAKFQAILDARAANRHAPP